MTNQKHADYHRQDNRDKLKPEMRHLARVDETDALHDTANNQDTAQEKDRSERRYYRVDQRQNASENHQTALYKNQSECRLTVWRIASRIAWAAASSDMVMVRLHSTNEKRICRSDHLEKTDDDGREMVNVHYRSEVVDGRCIEEAGKAPL